MKSNYTRIVRLFGMAAVACAQVLAAAAADGPYHLVKRIPLRGAGGCDGLAIDEVGQRLYAARGNRIEVIDLNRETVIGAIADMPDVRGFTLTPTFHIGYASNGKSATVSVVDLGTLRTTAKMKTGSNPAVLLFEPSRLELYVLNEGGHSVTVGKANEGDALVTVDLGGKPTAITTDPTAPHESKTAQVYCAIEDKNEVVAIEAATHKVMNHWPVAPGQAPRSIALDAGHHRLFIGCTNQLLLMMDSTSGKVLATVPIGADVGATVFDPGTQYALSASGEGTLTIVHEDTPEKLAVVQTLKTARGARALALHAQTHRVYLGTGDFGAPAGNASGRTTPGRLEIIVFGM